MTETNAILAKSVQRPRIHDERGELVPAAVGRGARRAQARALVLGPQPRSASGLDIEGRVVMRTRYCVQHQVGLCDGTGARAGVPQPLFLVDPDGHRYRLRFRCSDCEMEVVY